MPTKHDYIAWDDDSPSFIDAWSSGNLFLDWATGCAGIPKGRVTECSGPESSGKSTLGLQTAANIWRTLGIPSVYYDFEDAFDPRYAKALGLTSSGLLLEQPESLEDFFERMNEDIAASIKKGSPTVALAIFDSVAAGRTRSDLKAEVDARTGGMERARLWTQYLSTNVKKLAESGISLVLVNQLRDFIEINAGFTPPGMAAMKPTSKTPGGRGIKFYSSLRIAFEQSSEIRVDALNPLTRKVEKTVVGKNVWLKVVKNKVAPPPWRKIKLQVRDGIGFDLVENMLTFAEVQNVMDRTKGVWTLPAGLAGPEPLVIAAADGVSGDDRVRQFFRGNLAAQELLSNACAARLEQVQAELSVSLAEAAMATAEDEEDMAEAMASLPDVPVLSSSVGNAPLEA